MNAYELADLMTGCPVKCYTQGDTRVDFHEIANMLRDQANQIEKLQKENAEFRGHISTLFKEYKEYWEKHK